MIVTSHKPGAFCWPELGTTDDAAAAKFYSGLFGWDMFEAPIGEGQIYRMMQIGGKDVAAIYSMAGNPDLRGVPPHWGAYVSVTSADDAVAKAASLGGAVIVPPFDVFEHGRMAVLQDPTGATFSVWQPNKHIGVSRINEPGALCWTELATRDVAAAERFYTSLFGWGLKKSTDGMEYTEFQIDGASIGGVMKMGDQYPPGVPPHWLTYFAVDDCDASVTKAASLGGHAIVPATDIPTVGRFAVLQDPQGAVFAVFKPGRV
jgi:predicted enzyme related to lactoylglutathione lyase